MDNALYVSCTINWYQAWVSDMPKSLLWLQPYVSYAILQENLMLLESWTTAEVQNGHGSGRLGEMQSGQGE